MEIPVLNEIMRDTVVEVDLDRIAFNVRQIKAMAGPGTQVAAVVKADGYGHGALGIAPAIMENGASLLAVATLSEAVELKQACPGYAGLIMGLTRGGRVLFRSRLSRVNHGTDTGPSAALCAGIRHHPDH